MHEPLVSTSRLETSRSTWLGALHIAVGFAAALLMVSLHNASRRDDHSAVNLVTGTGIHQRSTLNHKHLDIDKIRLAAKQFVSSLDEATRNSAYFTDPALQVKQWELCTIVQQCLTPKFGVAMGEVKPHTRGMFYHMLALTLSDEGYKRLMVQQLSNLLLGEMQNWAVNCPGHCAEMDDPSGEIPIHFLSGPARHRVNASKEECKRLADSGRYMLWDCDFMPQMIHHGNLNTTSGRYFLGNIFNEPLIHARNDHYDFAEVYGTLEEGEPFGFRFSGHHYDLSFKFGAENVIDDLPVFIGHNPLVVPRKSPPFQHSNTREYSQWRNMAGIGEFPDIVTAMLKVTKHLSVNEYVPLSQWESTPQTGGLTLRDGKTMSDVSHIRLAEVSEAKFSDVWEMIDYALESARGIRPTTYERQLFRKEGRMCWTTFVHENQEPRHHLPDSIDELIGTRSFIYIQVETDELLYFGLMNTLFTLVVESEPSNHLHMMLTKKSQLSKWKQQQN